MNNAIAYIKEALRDHFQPEEIRSLTRLILKSVCDLEPHQIFLCKDNELSEAEKQRIRRIADRAAAHEPIHYIIGNTTFYGRTFRVSPAVLIPRPETEELVELIVRNEKAEGLKLLDIGTGSGCIAISLANELANPDVWALDISEEALAVARENAEANNAVIHFSKVDIVSDAPFGTELFDLIVSNPPYVTNSERAQMDTNVLAYEPHGALFVPDDDPLLFYRAIASFGRSKLRKGGRVYVEINAAFGEETRQLFLNMGYAGCTVRKDLSGKDRIVLAIR